MPINLMVAHMLSDSCELLAHSACGVGWCS